MNVLLWILQLLLAAAFFAHGLLFLNPPAEIAVQMDASFPRWFQVSLGVAEVLAAVGLTLPGVTRHYRGFSQAAEENGLSRLYAGIHFRHAIEAGRRQGRSIGKAVSQALPKVR